MNDQFEKLKKKLFKEGIEAIETFLGYKIPDKNEDKDVTDRRMDIAYDQISEPKLREYYKKYNIQ